MAERICLMCTTPVHFVRSLGFTPATCSERCTRRLRAALKALTSTREPSSSEVHDA